MEIKTKEDLIQLLTDYETRLTGMQEILDSQNQKEEASTDEEKTSEEGSDDKKEDEEEIELDELDKLLHED